MAADLARHIRERAAGRCEYCRLPQKATSVPFEIDHVISRKHGGRTVASNLATHAGIAIRLRVQTFPAWTRRRGS